MRNRLVSIVDDDIAFARELSNRLREKGLETVIIGGGMELISVLNIDVPDVIIIDTMLNWIDSRELIGALKKNPAFKKIKVFLVTEQKAAESINDNNLKIFQKVTDTDLLIKKIIEENDSDETS
ncbi:MAG: response regulator [Myxococcota bacterium]